ncbi:MAG: PorV/PorQ family protein [bacterium]|jgi:hypothetical protein|nr:PorV/PorQ family protein [bacterium]
MKKHIILLLGIVLLCSSFNLEAQTFRKVGSSAAQFLKIGVGSRALAMSSAFAGVSNDANALYWNPAGIANIRQISWTASHTNWIADIAHQFTGLIVPLGLSSSIGFSATFVSMDQEEITTEASPQGTGFFWDATDLAVAVSYARWMTDRFAIGITAKYVSQKIWNESASTVAFDIGTYLNTHFKGIVIGMCFSNFGGSLQLAGRDLFREYDFNPNNSLNVGVDTRLHTEPWPLPVNFRVGVAMDVIGQAENFIQSADNRFTLAVDGNHPNDDSEKLNFGMEYGWKETIFARFGYGVGYDLANVTYGGGLKFKVSGANFLLDYALAPYQEFGNIHYFTIGLNF